MSVAANGFAYGGAIAVLAILVIVHELGHFLAARWQGIHVNRFSIGFGPILWKYQGSETEYAIRGIPLGGFVGFPEDDPEGDIPPDDPNLLRNRPLFDRAIVISAGVIANLIFAYLVLVLQIGMVGLPGYNYQPGVLVSQVISPETVAAQSGIKPGDIILAIDDQPLPASEQAIFSLRKTIESHPNQTLSFSIQRQQQTLTVEVTPQPDAEGHGKIGVGLDRNGHKIHQRPHNPFKVLSLAADEFQRITVLIAQGFAQLITHFGQMADQVAGPVKIVEEGARLVRADSSSLFTFTALISINLAMINILPLPALDGGQLVLLLIEGLQGKPIPTRIQDGIMQTGLVLILGLGVFLIIRDTAQLLQQ